MVRVAIVGAGVAGCYCAYRLSHEDPRNSVGLFEASDRVGGRLWSVALDNVAGSPAEMGGMFIGDKQENLVGLVRDELKLACAPVDWERRHQFLRGHYFTDESYTDGTPLPFSLEAEEAGNDPVRLLLLALEAIVPGFRTLWPMDVSTPDKTPDATIAHLRAVVRGKRRLWEWGFWNLLSEVVSNEAYNLLLATIGSASMFRNTNAYDAVWIIMHEASQGFIRITAGYQTLPETLVERAGPACTLHLQHRLTRVRYKKGKFRLHFQTAQGDKIVEADKVILAVPRRALELFELDEAIIGPSEWRELLGSVYPVPACKLFLTFAAPWWNTSAIGPVTDKATTIAASYTDLPMRQCYYFGAPSVGQPALLMATYADDVASSFWTALGQPEHCHTEPPADQTRRGLRTSVEMEDAAQRQLSAMHHDIDVPEPIEGLFFDWSTDPYGGAWHAWAPHRKSWEVAQQIRQPDPAVDLYICGEAFAQVQGWVEGAINNAEMTLQKLGLPRPSWVRADYAFEYTEKETDMASKLSDLLVDLSEDLQLQKAFGKNPKAVMKKHGLTAAEQAALLSGDEAQILAAIGKKSGLKLFKIIVKADSMPKPKRAKAKAKAKGTARRQA